MLYAFMIGAVWLGGILPAFSLGTNVVVWGAGEVINTSSENDYGQDLVPPNLTNAVLVSGGWQFLMALKPDGTLVGWGNDIENQTNFPGTNYYMSVACGDLSAVALLTNGTVVAEGDDTYGEIDVPASLSNVVKVTCGFYHTLALKANGTLVAWGGTGDGANNDGVVPAGISNVVDIAAGGYHDLVLQANGNLFGIGNDDYGQTNIPPGLSNVIAIAAGDYYNLALKSNGTVVAWCFTNVDDSSVTNVPAGLTNVVAIAARQDLNLALKSNGTVVAWGENTENDTIVPAGLTNVVQIATGDVNGLALVNTDSPWTQSVVVKPAWSINGFSVTIPTQYGHIYQLQYKNALTDSAWQILPLCAGTGGNVPLTDHTDGNQRYYRVMRW